MLRASNNEGNDGGPLSFAPSNKYYSLLSYLTNSLKVQQRDSVMPMSFG